MKFFRSLFIFCACLALLTPSHAEVTSIEGAELGKHLHGPELSLEEVKGRVMFVIQWNVIDTLSKQALQAAERTYKKFSKDGFVVIASQTKRKSDDQAVEWCRQNKISFPVYGRTRLSGDDDYNVPRCWLFDWKGNVITTGRPETVLQEVGGLVKKAPHWLLGGRKFTSPEVLKLIPKLKTGKGFGKLIGSLEKAAKKGPEAAEDANFLKARLEAFAEARLARAEKAVTNSPLSALSQFVEVKGLFKGHKSSDQAAKRLKELKKDKGFQNNCKAFKALEAFQKLATKLNRDLPKEHPANTKVLGTMYGLVKKMKKKFPESKATKDAEAYLKGLAFKKAKKS